MKKRVVRSMIPNLLTLGNLFSGFTAIIYISKGDIYQAAVFILMAGIFDLLDGVAARLIGSTSEFGAELDSLCDAVSFGVAPAYMLYSVHFYMYNEIGILISSLPALGGVVRLARFNVKLVSFEDKRYFVGLPIPSSAITIISFIVFFYQGKIIPGGYYDASIIAVTLICSLAMVSTVKYDNTPRPTPKSFRQRPVVSVLFYLGVVAVIVSKGFLLFPLMFFYITAGAIRHFYKWIRLTLEPEDEIDETIESEPEAFEE
jgi:CDP-diacylglycerol---serine O-phosphatidyltransferase